MTDRIRQTVYLTHDTYKMLREIQTTYLIKTGERVELSTIAESALKEFCMRKLGKDSE